MASLPEPTTPFQVRARAAYPARSAIEITLEKEHIYTVSQTDGKGLWWQATDPQNKVGWFPASFVEVLKNNPTPPASVLPPPPAVAQAKPAPAPLARANSSVSPEPLARPTPVAKPQPTPKPTPVQNKALPVSNLPPTPGGSLPPIPVSGGPTSSLPPTPGPTSALPPTPGRAPQSSLPAAPLTSNSPSTRLPPTPGGQFGGSPPAPQPQVPSPMSSSPNSISSTGPASLASSAGSINSSRSPASPAATRKEKPPPAKEKKEKGVETETRSLKVQIMDTEVGDLKKQVTAFICRHSIYEPTKCEEVLKTATIKKTTKSINFNELFHVGIKDAEEQYVVVRFCVGTKLKLTGKEFIGESKFMLRGAVRDFNSPDFQYKRFPVLNGKSEIGQCNIYIEYFDKSVTTGPKNFVHARHLGFDPATGKFDMNNIPPEWKKVFSNAGVKPAHLKNASPEFAEKIFSIMENADLPAPAATGGPPLPSGGGPKATGGPPLPPAGGAAKATGGPPLPPAGGGAAKTTGGPPAPAAPKATGGPPPPMGGPPPPGGGPPPPGGGPPKLVGGPKPPGPPAPAPAPAVGGPPPAAVSKPSGGGLGMGDLASQLALGKEGLKNADSRPVMEKPAASAPPASLEDALRDAMKGFRPAIEGADDEWSDDDDWD